MSNYDFEIPQNIQNKWQEIIDIMANIIGVPSGLIMRLNNENIEVFLTSATAENPYSKGDSEVFKNSGLYCETVVNTEKKLLVPNALKSIEWRNNPDIKLNMISYLGFPLRFPDRSPFGTICVLDNKENSYSDLFIELVNKFKSVIDTDLELLYVNHKLGHENKALTDYIDEIKILRGMIPICARCKKIKDKSDGYWKKLETYIEKYSEAYFSHCLCNDCLHDLYGDKKWFEKIKHKYPVTSKE